MTNAFTNAPKWATVKYQSQRNTRFFWLWFAVLSSLTSLIGFAFFLREPTILPIGIIVGLAGSILIIREPRFGLYVILFFSLLGDRVLMPRYPFNKNLSSVESILYIHDALIFNPIEMVLVLVSVAWFIKMWTSGKFYF